MSDPIAAPFPYMGGKSRVASLVWDALGDVDSYVEPFCGSAAVLLARPVEHQNRREIVNDSDGFIANVWRSLAWHPDETAAAADWPTSENDLHARHAWLVGERDSLTARLEGDPEWCDPRAAGWWMWGACCWIGGGWCSGKGPWHVVDGQLLRLGDAGQGVKRQRVHLGNDGQGVKRARVHLGDDGQGDGLGDVPWGDGEHLRQWFHAIAARLEHVSVCVGDWARVTGPTPLHRGSETGIAGVFFDPPYANDRRTSELYAHDNGDVSGAVREWCVTAGADTTNRIVLAGYSDEHDALLDHNWRRESWSGKGGYGRNSKPDGVQAARHTETLWYSPECLGARTPSLF